MTNVNEVSNFKEYKNKIKRLKNKYNIKSWIILLICTEKMEDKHEFDDKILFIIKKINNYSYKNIKLDNNSIKKCILKYFDLKLYNYDEIIKLL